MMDYRAIEALYTVIELQSFEAAAKKLHLTQSAVSQRIKGLEMSYSEPVIIRTLPYRPTLLGNRLIAHFKQIWLLEEDLSKELKNSETNIHIAIAINRDSLETWFLELIENKEIFSQINLEIIADDQERTLDYFKKGMVSACISTSEREVLGGKNKFVGETEYVLVASPQFVKKHFSSGSAKQCLKKAPALIFDRNDHLHEQYLEKFFGLTGNEMNYHIIPFVKGFKKFALLGYGYALIPKLDIQNELKAKKLIAIFPEKNLRVPLYWHYWAVQSKRYQKFNDDMIYHARKKLEFER